MSKTPWQKTVDRKTDNIGFITKTGAFRDPTPAEKEVALLHEAKSWQGSKGKRTYSVSAEYSIPLGHGRNIKENIADIKIRKEIATKAYVETPMVLEGKFKDSKIDLSPYKMSKCQKVLSWFKSIFHKKPNDEARKKLHDEQLVSLLKAMGVKIEEPHED